MSSTHKSIGACKSICAQAHKVSKLEGDISPADIDKLEEELAEISTTVKSSYFPEGSKYGHLPMVIPQDKVRTLVADPVYIYSAQGDPGAYDPLAANNNTASQREQQVAVHEEKRTTYEIGLGVAEGLKELIVYAAGRDALDPLKKKYIGFGDTDPHAMLKFLRTKAAVQMTALDKIMFKAKRYAKK